jgi:copper transport protein
VRRLACALAAAAALVLFAAGPASAHAVLESTGPGSGSVVASAPRDVTATFDESVGVSADSLRVFAPDGARVDDGDTTHGDAGDQIEVGLRGSLDKGTYTVAWHVVSADSHPVEGAFTFSIGAPSSTSVDASTLTTHASAVVGLLFGAVRWLGYLSFALLFGGVVFLVACWPGGARERRVLRLLALGWTGSVLAGIGALLIQGVYGGGLPIGRALDSGVLSATLDSRFGQAVVARLLVTALSAPLLALGIRRLPGAGRRAQCRAGGLTLVLGALAAASWAVSDHAGTGSQVPVAVPSDVLHLCAMGIWLGGLAVLVSALLRVDHGPEPDAADPEQAVRAKAAAVQRFSPIALACVCSLAVTGVYQAWREVGSWNALFGTGYGHLVILKIAGLAAVVGLGRVARSWLALLPERRPAPSAEREYAATAGVAARRPAAADRLGGGGTTARRPGRRVSRVGAGTAVAARSTMGPRPGPGAGPGGGSTAGGAADPGGLGATLRGLRRTVAAEAGVAIAILAVSSLLVESEPGRTAETGPTDTTVQFDTGTASGSILVYVAPATLGPNQAHIYISTPKGLPYDPAQVTADFVLPAQNLGPLTLHVEQDGPGHYLDVPVVLDFRGTWELEITIRSDDFDETTIRVPVNVS